MLRRTAEIFELDAAGAAFLDLLVELGHLDERLLGQVNDQLLELRPPDDQGDVIVVLLQDVRRVAAEVIEANLGDTDPEYRRAIAREWPLLFH